MKTAILTWNTDGTPASTVAVIEPDEIRWGEILLPDAAGRARVLSGLQGQRAYSLALAHWHLWATALASAGIDPEGMTLGAIAEMVAKIEDPTRGIGIFCPQYAGEDIVHTTTTGRLRWRIEPNGATHFVVSRPAGDVLLAYVAPTGTWLCERRNADIPLCERHVDAMQWALSAIAPDANVPGAFPDAPEYDPVALPCSDWQSRARADGIAEDLIRQVAKKESQP